MSVELDFTPADPIADNRYRRLLEAAPDGIVEVDSSGRIVLVNSQAEKLFGYAREELLGKAVEMLMPDRFRKRHPAHRGRYQAHSVIRPMGSGLDLRALRADGTEFAVDINLSPFNGVRKCGVELAKRVDYRSSASSPARTHSDRQTKMTCLSPSSKCEKPFTDVFVTHLNDAEGTHHVPS